MRTLALCCFVLVAAIAPAAAEEPVFEFPQVAGYGSVVAIPNAAVPPRSGARIVFDITSDSKPEEVNKGLEAVARYLNLNAQARLKPNDVKLALVLHGGATKAALGDAAYSKHTSSPMNPNLKLIRELKTCGVEVFVCGQSLARNRFAASEVTPDLTIAVSALTVNVNKQLDGFAYLAIH